MSIKFNNLNQWQAKSTNPNIVYIEIKLNEYITLREYYLIRLRYVISYMETCYWKYCIERIRASEKLLTIKSKLLLELLHLLTISQKEVTVLIAMIRSISIVIIESVMKLRKLYKRKIITTSNITIYWKDENYLLKMRRDCDFLHISTTIRLWLGFIGNDLMLPPPYSYPTMKIDNSNINTSNDNNFNYSNNNMTHNHNIQYKHNPKVVWYENHHKLYLQWFQKHQEYIIKMWDSGIYHIE